VVVFYLRTTEGQRREGHADTNARGNAGGVEGREPAQFPIAQCLDER
jgi:hypothetical protein